MRWTRDSKSGAGTRRTAGQVACTAVLVLGAAAASPGLSPARADEVHLTNGDRLSGTVLRLEAGKLVLQTPYAGEVRMDWSAVARLGTEGDVTVVLESLTLRGPLSAPEDGRLAVATVGPEPPVSVELSRVEAINPPQPPPVRLSGGLSFSLVSASGNTESDNLVLQGELEARTEKSRTTLGALANEAREDGNETASKATAYLGYDHFLTERWFLSSDARFTEDELQDLNLRSSLGVGLGRQFRERDRAALSLELGVSQVNEDFIAAEDRDFSAARWGLDVKQPLADAISFFHRQEGLLSLENSDDLVVQTQSGLRFSLFRGFVAAAQLNWDWDNVPSPGLEKEDTTYLLTLGYDW